MNNPENLREEIIAAIKAAPAPDQEYGAAECLFDNHIMPILQKAMDKGELLVARTSKERTPLPATVLEWIDGVLHLSGQVMEHRNTISKRELLKIFFSLTQNATRAKADIEARG